MTLNIRKILGALKGVAVGILSLSIIAAVLAGYGWLFNTYTHWDTPLKGIATLICAVGTIAGAIIGWGEA